jgi:ubiquitin carboxyl-terminal hydrolase 5/13
MTFKPEDGSPPPPKISKLAIVAESEEDRYTCVTKVKCYACNGAEIDTSSNPQVMFAIQPLSWYARVYGNC